ncbi:hypothetical protein PHMEG_00017255 [Phytophthora megakarya]|uniref:Uncharacterized protein n=1 Tax=Phytophthora megakarya TaxID=4795 RepID=A0A225VX13_9STRA|nr:hypothetical protein PHMEG_00017255 [Phytophthora megakarya]
MLGDVSGAFRHIPVAADHVHMFGFRLDGYIVIDLASGFGWCGSPDFYAVAGSLINHFNGHSNFFHHSTQNASGGTTGATTTGASKLTQGHDVRKLTGHCGKQWRQCWDPQQ